MDHRTQEELKMTETSSCSQCWGLQVQSISFSASYLVKSREGIYLEGGNFSYRPMVFFKNSLNQDADHYPVISRDDVMFELEETLNDVKEKWDHYTYLPLKSKFITLKSNETHYTCRWRWNKKKMEMLLPKTDCLILPTGEITLKNICFLMTIDYLTALKLLHPHVVDCLSHVKGCLESVHGSVSLIIQEESTLITAR